MGRRRSWWEASTVAVGVGAALLSGAGVAAAETGSGAGSGTGADRQASTEVSAPSVSEGGPGLESPTEDPPNSHSASVKPRSGTATPVKPNLGSRPRGAAGTDHDYVTTAITDGVPDAQDMSVASISFRSATSRRTVVVSVPEESTGIVPAVPAAAAAVVSPEQTPAGTFGTLEKSAADVARPIVKAQSIPELIATAVFSLLSGLAAKLPDNSPRSGLGASAPTWVAATSTANGVVGVQVGHSSLTIPLGASGYTAAADWYFPTQADGSVQANGVVWLQHGFLSDKSAYTALASQLAQTTNSIVVVPNLPSLAFECADCSMNSSEMQKAVASMFQGGRSALNASAVAAGLSGALPEDYILAGHSAGGGFAASVAGYTVDIGAATGNLLAVIMYDGVSVADSFAAALNSLDMLDVPVYQLASQPQLSNLFGLTTDDLATARPDRFTGVTLLGGSHLDAVLGSNPLVDVIAQVLTLFAPSGNSEAVKNLSSGWINDLYVGAGPADPQFGIYGAPGESIVLEGATAVVLSQDFAATLSPLERVLKSLAAQIVTLLSQLVSSQPTQPTNPMPTDPTLPAGPVNGVSNVTVGHSDLSIPFGEGGYTAPADWYFPAQEDGSVQPNGVIWLQHGFFGSKELMSVLATQLARETNSIVVVPTLPSLPLGDRPDVYVTSVHIAPAIAQMFVGDREALQASAVAAGYQAELPEQFILAGHSFGGGLAADIAGETVDNGAAAGNLLGVIMFDGVSPNGTFRDAITSLDEGEIPVYQIAAPAQMWNQLGQTTDGFSEDDLAGLRPNQFVGVELVGGSHFDAVLGANPVTDLIAQLVSSPSPEGNTQAAATLAAGWINDMYIGAGPDDPRYGIYGTAGQSINIGKAVANVLPAVNAFWATAIRF